MLAFVSEKVVLLIGQCNDPLLLYFAALGVGYFTFQMAWTIKQLYPTLKKYNSQPEPSTQLTIDEIMQQLNKAAEDFLKPSQ